MVTYFGAKVLMSLLFSAIIVVLLFVLGVTFGNVHLPAAFVAEARKSLWSWERRRSARSAWRSAILAGPNSASPNRQHDSPARSPPHPDSGCRSRSCLRLFRRIAPALPPFSFVTVGARDDRALTVGRCRYTSFALVGFAAGFLVLASIGYRRDEGRTYG